MKYVLMALIWSNCVFSSSVTFHFEIKSPKYKKCIKIKNTNLELLDCDGQDLWEINYDSTSGQANIFSGPKNWYIINRSTREKKDDGAWAWFKDLFKTSKPTKTGKITIGVHEHDPADFIFNKDITETKNSLNVTIVNDAEEKCLEVEENEKRFYIVLNKCSDDPSQKWEINRLEKIK